MTVSVFPSFPGLEIPITRTPMWLTIIQESIGGVVTPQSPWSYPRWKWELSFSFLRQAPAYVEAQTLMGFFNQNFGRALTFRYNDPNDSTSGAAQTIGVGDGVTTAFQLVRTFGGFIEPVFAVSTDPSTHTIIVGSTQFTSTMFSVDSKGLVSFSSGAPTLAQTITWSGSFGWYCRFDADNYPFEMFTASSDYQGPLWAQKKMSFTSIKFGA